LHAGREKPDRLYLNLQMSVVALPLQAFRKI